MQSLESRDTYACRTVRTKIKDFSADLKHMKLAQGEIRSRKHGNVVAIKRKVKRLVISTNTAPGPKIQPVEERVNKRRNHIIPPEAMKKPKAVKVYNSGMNGVRVNN